MCVCVYVYTTDCVEILYELPLLPNNHARETIEKVRSADWIFTIGRRHNIEQNVLNLLVIQGVVAAPFTSTFSS